MANDMSHDDFAFEPVRGLPERLPAGEHILWQGSPSWWRLAQEAMGLRWIAGYFVLLALWRVGVNSADMSLVRALNYGVPYIALGAAACAIVCLLAWIQSKATVYTLTNKRVGMRIGAALTMTLNLPYARIGSADLDLRRGGSGTLAFQLLDDVRFSYVLTWPHVRPWHIAHTQPALRCIPDAARIAAIMQDAAEMVTTMPQVAQTTFHPAPSAIAAE